VLSIQRVRSYLSAIKLHETLANWAIVLLGLFVVRGARALALIVVARRVSPIEYGQYISSYGLASLLVVLPNYGLESWLLTRGHSTTLELLELWSSSIRVRVQLLLVWLVGMVLLGMVLPPSAFPPTILFLSVLGVAFDSLVSLSYAAFRSFNQHSRVTFFQVVSSLVLLGITLGLPLGTKHIELFAIGRTTLSAILVVVTIAVIGKSYLKYSIIPIPILDILRSARHFMVAELASTTYVRVDLTLVSLILGSSVAGIYGTALNFMQVFFLIPRALYFLIVPILSRDYAKDRKIFVRQSLIQFLAQVVVGAMLSVVIFLLAPTAIDFVFGPAYQSSAKILRLFSPIPFLRAVNFALGAMLASGGRQSQRTKVQLICAVFSVLANLIVIFVFGITGVAIVYVFSELILCLGYLLITRDWLSGKIIKVGGR